MGTVVIIFMVIAAVFAVATLSYVIVDLVMESKKKQERSMVDTDAENDP